MCYGGRERTGSALSIRTLLIVGAVLLVVLIVAVGGLMTFVVGTPDYYSAKYSRAGGQAPTATPAVLVPENQTQPHTCGFHSISTIYRAYGMDPEASRLRFRLGTDMPTNLLAQGSTTGTIHPDILRVLGQDGFETQVVLPGETLAVRLRGHLESGHPALVLTRVSTWHWVVAASIREGKVTVCDSLQPTAYEEPLEAYSSERVYNVILIRPKAR